MTIINALWCTSLLLSAPGQRKPDKIKGAFPSPVHFVSEKKRGSHRSQISVSSCFNMRLSTDARRLLSAARHQNRHVSIYQMKQLAEYLSSLQ